MNVAIVMGHPNKSSFSAALAKSYEEGAKAAGHKVRFINVIDMKFNALEQVKKVEKDVVYAQETMKWANHIVFVFPTWWSTTPALMKGFFDRVFAAGVTYKFISNMKWEKLLKGRSARVITTMGSPAWVYKCIMGNPLKKNIKGTLNFCGLQPVTYTYVDKIMRSTDESRKQWLTKVKQLAMKD